MNLLNTLQEASGHPIDDLKKILMKDKRTKPLFQKHLDLDDIENKVEFLNTAKFFMLNNRNVLQFVEDRDYVKALSKSTLKRLRELKPTELTQKNIDDLLEFTSDLFREFGYVERSGISGATRKELVDWKNANGRYFDLTRATQRELMSIPGLRPTRPTLLYRGLLFNSHDLKERKRYDGQLEVGKGLQFLRSIREGSRIVDLDWDRASSWSTSKEVAMQFAKFGSAKSNFGATMQWLERAKNNKAIDGDLGFIISTLAKPDDILIDIERLVTAAHMKHGSEAEMILKPGKYTCRVYTKYTPAGEVDPSAGTEIDESIEKAVQGTREFARTWEVKSPEGVQSSEWRTIDAERALGQGDTDTFKKLASRGTKDEVLRSYGELKKFYDEYIRDLKTESLQSLLADVRVGKVIQWIIDLQKMMNGQDRHPAFKSPQNSRGLTTVKEMSPEQYRQASYTIMADRVKDGTSGRYTDSSIGRFMNTLAKGFGKKDAVDSDIHRRSRKDQEEQLNQILDGFFSTIDKERPADFEEASMALRNALAGAERNSRLLNTLLNERDTLSAATKSETSD